MRRALVVQTAFLGDVILTLPLVQTLKKSVDDAQIDFIAIPETSDILKSHPDISRLIIYDKHGEHKSLSSFLLLGRELRANKYDVVLCPHRSLRSCLTAKYTQANVRAGFDNSALKSCFTDVLPWKFGVHEVERNLSLLTPLGINAHREEPRLFPTAGNREEIELFLKENRVTGSFAVVAPGTVWKTKRYPIEMMSEVVRKLLDGFSNIVIVGGKKDAGLVEHFTKIDRRVISAIGRFSIMSSAELIRRASLLVANDSAPIHIASAFNVPTVAVFGPTVRDFGFFPYHERSAVVEVENLGCRPCSLHGGDRCPINTFDCMRKILPDRIVAKGLELLEKKNG